MIVTILVYVSMFHISFPRFIYVEMETGTSLSYNFLAFSYFVPFHLESMDSYRNTCTQGGRLQYPLKSEDLRKCPTYARKWGTYANLQILVDSAERTKAQSLIKKEGFKRRFFMFMKKFIKNMYYNTKQRNILKIR